MNQEKVLKLEELSIEIHTDLRILNSAVNSHDEDLQVSDLVNFVEKMYKISNEISEIFAS